MKKNILYLALLLSASLAAQIKPSKSSADFELGSGLNFMFNDSAYHFRISGMVQPYMAFDRAQGGGTNNNIFNAKRAYLNFYGNAAKEKVSFFFQLDFSNTTPLLDAWVAFHPTKTLNITFGQKQNIANNREMLIMEDHLQFPDRSLLSTAYSLTGREFGIYVDYTMKFGLLAVVPQVAMTSGDGRNSFGEDSRDIDLGGFKYAARLDLYPFGLFLSGNNGQIADLLHEKKLKMALGGAASFNTGASQAVGEGHGVFLLFDENGAQNLPDYRQLYGDILMKYNGFSFLGEYVIATATNLEGTFRNEGASIPLLPAQISEYLALGTGYNLQGGYATKSGYGLDARYFGIMPEFGMNGQSVIQENSGWSVGVSRYFKGQAAKIQLAFTTFNNPMDVPVYRGEILLQVIF